MEFTAVAATLGTSGFDLARAAARLVHASRAAHRAHDCRVSGAGHD
ncbi:MAG: hypothetical protein ACRD9W_20325 [Terriglobia bacterium]